MSSWLLAIVAVIYLGVAISYARERDYGMALAFIAYALANVGFIWSKP
jgi:hypothetical protein